MLKVIKEFVLTLGDQISYGLLNQILEPTTHL